MYATPDSDLFIDAKRLQQRSFLPRGIYNVDDDHIFYDNYLVIVIVVIVVIVIYKYTHHDVRHQPASSFNLFECGTMLECL
jgi:hypothetical protein